MDLATGFSTDILTSARRARKRVRIAVRTLVALGLLAAVALAGWWVAARPIGVSGARAARGPVAELVYATGFVEPKRPVDVSSRVTAPVTAVLADEGERVVRGEALAVLDAEDQRQSIAQLSAERVKAEQDEQRALALFRQGWMARAGRDQAVASASSARAAEAAARAKLDQFTIRSGIAGLVLRRDVEPGDLATPSRTLFEVGDPGQLRVTATVDERDIPLVRIGSPAMMSTQAYPGRVFRGSVYEITPAGDPDQRAFRVRIAPDETRLPIGLTVEVNIMVTQRQHALLVPAGAIRDGGLWVVEDGKARRRTVRVGIRASERSEITSGLADRACVITDPPAALKDGERVDVKGC